MQTQVVFFNIYTATLLKGILGFKECIGDVNKIPIDE